MRYCISGTIGSLLAITILAGCTFGETKDGRFVAGIPVNSVGDSIKDAVKPIAGILPPPWGDLLVGALGIGSAIGGVTTAHYRAKRNGEREGWDERGTAPLPSNAPLS